MCTLKYKLYVICEIFILKISLLIGTGKHDKHETDTVYVQLFKGCMYISQITQIKVIFIFSDYLSIQIFKDFAHALSHIVHMAKDIMYYLKQCLIKKSYQNFYIREAG